ncbi:hypothetical protein KP509_04G035000 [Ceratopteris richardii]|nr:hypothetical protein KP509_04G035000 [Ceratopteris richardii]
MPGIAFSSRRLSIEPRAPLFPSRFISVLSVTPRRTMRRNAILALDPDFYKIPYVEGVPVGKRLKLWNLPANLDQQEFLDWFKGLEGVTVESLELTDDPDLNAQGIGGFIEFASKMDACMAIVRRDGHKFKGRCIRMDFVEKRPHEREIGGRRNRPSYRNRSQTVSSYQPRSSYGSGLNNSSGSPSYGATSSAGGGSYARPTAASGSTYGASGSTTSGLNAGASGSPYQSTVGSSASSSNSSYAPSDASMPLPANRPPPVTPSSSFVNKDFTKPTVETSASVSPVVPSNATVDPVTTSKSTGSPTRPTIAPVTPNSYAGPKSTMAAPTTPNNYSSAPPAGPQFGSATRGASDDASRGPLYNRGNLSDANYVSTAGAPMGSTYGGSPALSSNDESIHGTTFAANSYGRASTTSPTNLNSSAPPVTPSNVETRRYGTPISSSSKNVTNPGDSTSYASTSSFRPSVDGSGHSSSMPSYNANNPSYNRNPAVARNVTGIGPSSASPLNANVQDYKTGSGAPSSPAYESRATSPDIRSGPSYGSTIGPSYGVAGAAYNVSAEGGYSSKYVDSQSSPRYGSAPRPGVYSPSTTYGSPQPAPAYDSSQASGSYNDSNDLKQATPNYGSAQFSPNPSTTPSTPRYGVAQPSPEYSSSPSYMSGQSTPGYGTEFGYGVQPPPPSYGSSQAGYGGVQAPPPSYGSNQPPSSFRNPNVGSSYGSPNYGDNFGNTNYGSPAYGRTSYGGASYGTSREYRIFVGNLPWTSDDMTLNQLFSAHGTVLEARVMRDRNTGRSRGFGFVSMSSLNEMQAAISALDGHQVDGRSIKVNEAER